MAKKHRPTKISGKRCEAEIALAQGGNLEHALRTIGVARQNFPRWCKAYASDATILSDEGNIAVTLTRTAQWG